jgi:hypothetical protein
MYYSRFRKEVGSDSQVGILNPTNIFLDISHYIMSVNDEVIKRLVRSKLNVMVKKPKKWFRIVKDIFHPKSIFKPG